MRAILAYDHEHTLIDAHLFRAWSGEVYVSATAGDNDAVIIEPFADQTYNYSQIDVRVGCNGSDPIPTDRTYAVITTGQRGPWTFTVESPDGLGFSSAHGSEAWGYRLHDFSGGVSAGTSILDPIGGVAIEGAIQVNARKTLVGAFTDRLPSAVISMSAETPHSTEQCPCYFANVTGSGVWGSGDYTFRATAAGAWVGGAYLLLADIEMPA